MNIVFYIGIVLIVGIIYICLSSSFKYIGLFANKIKKFFVDNLEEDLKDE